MNGYVTMWTSALGLKNMINNKQFIGYSEKNKLNRIQISVPQTAIMTFENIGRYGELVFHCFKKDLWL